MLVLVIFLFFGGGGLLRFFTGVVKIDFDTVQKIVTLDFNVINGN